MGFLSFLVYCLTASIIAGFGVQGVLLQRLSLTETVLYCAARIVIVFASGLFASVLYRRFADQGMTWYKRLAVLVMLIGALYSMTETFFGRAAVSLNSHQHQSADLGEAKVKQSAAEALTGSAEASTSASKRFASSNKRGSLWGQVETAKSATTNATAAVGLSEQAAKLQREAGVTEQQVIAMVSPWEPLPTQLAMAAWFAVLVELVMLLASGGAADYIASRAKGTSKPSTRSDDNVVPMPSPAARVARQHGRMLLEDFEPAKFAQTTHQDQTKVEPKSVNPPMETGLKRVARRSKSGVKPDQKKLTKTQAIAAINRGEQSPDLGKLKVAVVGGQRVAKVIREELEADGTLVRIDKRGKLGLAS